VNSDNGIKFGAQDEERLRRLLEEVEGRLHEVALIATRVRGESLDATTVPIFKPRKRATEDDEPTTTIEILDVDGWQCCLTITPYYIALNCPC
jgi:hypothetical protein